MGCGASGPIQYYPKAQTDGQSIMKISIPESIYSGRITSKQQTGYGVFKITAPNASQEIKDTKYQGFWHNGNLLIGRMRNNSFAFPILKYEGEFDENRNSSGFGAKWVYEALGGEKYKIKESYIGFFRRNDKHGFGVETNDYGMYIGYYSEGCRSGLGQIIRTNQNKVTTYKGNFCRGVLTGLGIKTQIEDGNVVLKEYSTYFDGNIATGSEIFTKVYREGGHAYNAEVLSEVNIRDHADINSKEIEQIVLNKYTKLKKYKLPKFALTFHNPGFIIESQIYQNCKIKMKLSKLNERKRKKYFSYAKVMFISHPIQVKFTDYEPRIYRLMNKLPNLVPYLPSEVYDRMYIARIHSGLVLSKLQRSIEEEIGTHRIAQILYMEYLNKENNLRNWIENSNYLHENPKLAMALCQQLLNMLKVFEEHNIYHGKLSPKYIFCFHQQSILNFNLILTNFSQAKISVNHKLVSKHSEIPEPLIIDPPNSILSTDIFNEPFNPSDYDYGEVYYLPPKLQNMVRNPFNPGLLTTHNVIKTQIFAFAVIMIEIFMQTKKYLQESKILRSKEKLTMNQYKTWVNVLSRQSEYTKVIKVYWNKMLDGGYNSFKEIPELFHAVVYQAGGKRGNQV